MPGRRAARAVVDLRAQPDRRKPGKHGLVQRPVIAFHPAAIVGAGGRLVEESLRFQPGGFFLLFEHVAPGDESRLYHGVVDRTVPGISGMLEGAGFEVVDIGINTDVDEYLAALDEHRPDILGMSALLTTTMPYMKVVIDTMKERGIRDDYIVLVGGAPLNEEFGEAIGADAYCRDAATAVEVAKQLVASG